MSQRILVVLSGLAEAPGDGPTTLEATPTLGLDALARRGAVRRVASGLNQPAAETVACPPDTDLAVHARTATALLRDGTPIVVVRVDVPARTAGDPAPHAKRQELLKVDRDLLAPLAGLAMDLGATLAVCAEHATDPATDRDRLVPAPAVLWGPGVPASGPQRMTEAATADSPVVDDLWTVA